MLDDIVTILNRRESSDGQFGVDSDGISWDACGCVHASVDWVRGKMSMNSGSLDVYGVVIVRMRWNRVVNMRSRIVHAGQTYQILGDTFHSDKRGNTIQFHAQAIVDHCMKHINNNDNRLTEWNT